MATRRDSPSTRIRDEQAARAIDRLRGQLARQMGVFTKTHEHGPRRSETVDQFWNRLGQRFALILYRFSRRQTEIWLASIARGPHRRRPGRPPKRRPKGDTRTILGGWRPPRKGRPKIRDVDDKEIVDLVDKWKAQAKEQRDDTLSDARALAELLFYHAPPTIRR
jgi:hypothetical protein